MSIKIEREHMKIPTKFKRSIKLTNEDKEEIRHLYATGDYSYNVLAEMFEVDKKTIYYALKPQKYAEFLQRCKENKHSQKYYSKEKHKGYMKNTRDYRKKLNEMNLLVKENKNE